MQKIPTIEWARHRDIFKQLYLTEDKKLKEVMGIMAKDRHFHPT